MQNMNIAPSFMTGKATDVQKQKFLHLRKGQFFGGQVLKLFPPHMAVLRFGSAHVTARMEAPLTAGESYIFRVAKNEGIPHLQVVQKQQSPAPHSKAPEVSSMLKSVGVEANKTNQKMAELLLREQAPLSKELLTKGGSLLTSQGMLNREGIETLLTIDRRQLPLNKTVFQAIRSTMEEKPLSTSIQELTVALKKVKEQNGLPVGQKKAVTRLLEALARTQETTSIPKSEKISVEQKGVDYVVRLAGTKKKEAVMMDRSSFTKLLKQGLPNPVQASNTSVVAEQLKSIVQQLGLTHEKTHLNTGDQPVKHQYSQLKYTLLEQITELPMNVKERAETILHRITGQQLLSQEHNGPLHYTAVQLPIKLGEHTTDLSIQWEGKKTDKGQVHPDHCRILFYLNLEELGETIADVQIQNRMVTLGIYNDNPRPTVLMDVLQPFLEERLTSLNYHLSSVNWKQIKEQTKDRESMSDLFRGEGGGVDIRV